MTGSNANAGRNEVKEDEYAGSSDTEGEHLTHIEATLGDEHRRESDDETLNKILNNAGDQITHEAVHFLYLYVRKKHRQLLGKSLNDSVPITLEPK